MAIADVPTAPLPVGRGDWIRCLTTLSSAFRAAATSHGILQKYVANFLGFAHTFE
jgi:hypothetical protein